MESRKVNMIVRKAGGNASKSSLNYKISIPTAWAKAMGVTEENRNMELSFDGERIYLEKVSQ